MESAGDDETVVLSEVEGEEPAPLVLPDEVSIVQFRETLLELEQEKLARKEAEVTKNELQNSFNRLKVLAHEAIKRRDEVSKQKEEISREKEEAVKVREDLAVELAKALKEKDEILKQNEETSRALEELSSTSDSLRTEIETTSHMLVSGSDRLAKKVSNFKNFSGPLPHSAKYTGLPATAFGVIKRMNEMVDELVRHVDNAIKGRNDAREQIEQRNFEIAIEVSQHESTISGLREEVAKKSSELETIEKTLAAKDAYIAEKEVQTSGKLNELDQACKDLMQRLEAKSERARELESKIVSQRLVFFDQLSYISKAHSQIHEIIKMVDPDHVEQGEPFEASFLPQELDVDEILQTSLSGTVSLFELMEVVAEKVSSNIEERNHEVRELTNTITRLLAEKQDVGTLLRSALSERKNLESVKTGRGSSEQLLKASKVIKITENGLHESEVESQFDAFDGIQKVDDKNEQEDEVFSLATALENMVRASQLEIMELRQSVESLRAESHQLKALVEAQTKEIAQMKHKIKDLEAKEKAANDNVEGLMMDITAAEEEIERWKSAAEQEAAAGRGVEEEYVIKLDALMQDVEAAKQRKQEADSKLKFKEETAAAAITARNAAEQSLRLADLRASRLRDRVEELTRQIEELEGRDSSNRLRQRYACWPWQWLGLQLVGAQSETQQQANEMELSEPLM